MSLKRRLEALEGRRRPMEVGSRWEIPVEVRALLRTSERWFRQQEREQAILDGREPPEPLPYEQWEIEYLKHSDEETVRFGSLWRYSQHLEALAEADERTARRRLEKASGLPPERWGEVWGDTQEEEEDDEITRSLIDELFNYTDEVENTRIGEDGRP